MNIFSPPTSLHVGCISVQFLHHRIPMLFLLILLFLEMFSKAQRECAGTYHALTSKCFNKMSIWGAIDRDICDGLDKSGKCSAAISEY